MRYPEGFPFKDIFYSRIFTLAEKKGRAEGKSKQQDLPGAGDVSASEVSVLKAYVLMGLEVNQGGYSIEDRQ